MGRYGKLGFLGIFVLAFTLLFTSCTGKGVNILTNRVPGVVTLPVGAFVYNLDTNIGSLDESSLTEFIAKVPKGETIVVDASSNGGSVYSSIAIYNTLRGLHSNYEIVTVANAYTMSGALVVWLAGERKYSYDNTEFLAHCSQLRFPWKQLRMKFRDWVDWEEVKRNLRKNDLLLYAMLAKESNKSLEWWENKLGHFWYPTKAELEAGFEPYPEDVKDTPEGAYRTDFRFGPEEAVQLGFMDRAGIIGSPSPVTLRPEPFITPIKKEWEREKEGRR